jgi:hypothetical protein
MGQNDDEEETILENNMNTLLNEVETKFYAVNTGPERMYHT